MNLKEIKKIIEKAFEREGALEPEKTALQQTRRVKTHSKIRI